ncbi:MAG: DUF4012 domain-containing protein [Candidatus Levybacteria bacterium]|nr:DUF4012 domain-containing protein [Candidatus Levybacteria bacterium]
MTTSAQTILIVDKEGIIGNGLRLRLRELPDINIVFVSKKKLPDNDQKTHFIKYQKVISSISNIDYSHIFIVSKKEDEILQALTVFIKKSEESGGRIIYITPVKIYKEKIEDSYKDFFTILIGDLFGTQRFKTIPSQILFQAKNGEIRMPGIGLKRLYPVFFDDAVSAILEVAFRQKHNKKFFYLFPKHAVTYLSFARILKKLSPEIKIDFEEEDESAEKDIEPEIGFAECALGEKYSLPQRVKESFENLNLKDQEDQIDEEEENPKKNTAKNKRIFFPSFVIFLFLVFLMPLFSTLIFSLLGVYELNSVKGSIEKGDFSSVAKNVKFSKNFFDLAIWSSKGLIFQASIIGKKDLAGEVIGQVEKAQEISSTIETGIEASKTFENILEGKSKNPKDDFTNASNSLKNAIVVFQKIKTQDSGFLKSDLITSEKIDNFIKIISSTIDVYPGILGFESEKKYLLLFQNNMELRPGGGFIGSYGLLTLKNGSVKDLQIHDVYDADGQLKGHIEPPFAIRRYIPLVHWYLRDSNFNVDFTKNAKNAAYFLNQETGDVVDGVIAVDVSFVKQMVEAMGSVVVNDYNETVTGENFYILTQSHAEKSFFPGSTQKKDFLRSLFNSIMLSISTKKNTPYLKLLENFSRAVDQKHILFAFGDPNIQNVFTVNGMSSALWDDREENLSGFNDFLGINEANIGVNKTNYFIKRKIDQEVSIDERGILEKVTIQYKNLSNAWPGGDYKNYLRLILPLSAKLTSISIDGQEQKTTAAVTDFLEYEAKDFKPPTELEVEETQEEQKKIYGFLVMVPQGALKKIVVSYSISQKAEVGENQFSYSGKIFKQPGTEEDPYSFSISYPQSIKPFNLPKDFTDDGTKINLSTKLSKDLDFKINFSPK